MTSQDTQDESTIVDGRTARRERGRLAVCDAMIDLVLGGHVPPTAEQVAERAGVSQASVFRYFDTLDELRGAAIQRYFERYTDLMAIPDIGDGSLTRRIKNLVEGRQRFYDATEPMARLARGQVLWVDELRDALHRVRATLAHQLAQHFEPELARLRPEARRERVAVIAALTSFESWDQLRDQGLDRGQLGRALRRALADLFD